jgi:O-antigen ligase
MKLTYILALVTISIFLPLFFFNKAPRRFYLLFIIYLFPLIDLPITTINYGSLKVFDGISYISFFFLAKDFLHMSGRAKIYLFLVCLLLIILVAGSLNSSYVNTSLFNILSVLPIFIYSRLLIAECSEDGGFRKEIIKSLKYVVFFSLIILIIQMCIGLNFTIYSDLNENTLDSNGLGLRYPSFFQDPQKYGQFLVMLSFLFLINDNDIKRPKFKNILLFLIIVTALLCTGVRSASIGLFAGMLILFFVMKLQYKVFLTISVIIGIFLAINFSDSVMLLNRTKSFTGDLSYRASLWHEAYDIYQDHKLLGVGMGNFSKYANPRTNIYFITFDNDVMYYGAESGYLTILTETGILGFFIFFSLILIPIFLLCRDHLSGEKDPINFFFIAAIVSWLVSFTSVYSISDKRILIIVTTLICFLISSPKINKALLSEKLLYLLKNGYLEHDFTIG